MWAAWAVHVYTAAGVLMAFAATLAVFADNLRAAFLWLFAAVIVDASDGVLARMAHVHERLPQFSGEMLDGIVDYLTFVFVPALIVWRAGLVGPSWQPCVVGAMLLSSAYGFARTDAKTADHFFTGFPSYWNIAVLYLVAAELPSVANAVVLGGLAALVFVRIGYVYPTRTPAFRALTITLTGVWALALLLIIQRLPDVSPVLILSSLIFPVYYVALSLVLHARRKSGR